MPFHIYYILEFAPHKLYIYSLCAKYNDVFFKPNSYKQIASIQVSLIQYETNH